MTKLIYVCAAFRVEKYRPQKLDDLISHRDILTTSKLKNKKILVFNNYLQLGLVSKQDVNIIRMSVSATGSYLSNPLLQLAVLNLVCQ